MSPRKVYFSFETAASVGKTITKIKTWPDFERNAKLTPWCWIATLANRFRALYSYSSTSRLSMFNTHHVYPTKFM